MRSVDTKEYLTMVRELVEQGKEVSVLVSGGSMTPFLGDKRDTIYVSKPERELKKGDMVFYQRSSGQFVMHRICKVKEDGFYIIGDAQQVIEGPVKREQIFGIITKVQRKGRWIGPGDFWWEFFEKVWVNMIPLRPLFRKLNSLRHLNKG